MEVAEPSQSASLHLVVALRSAHSHVDAPNPCRPQPSSRAAVEDSGWQPNGVVLQVRFCEGPARQPTMAFELVYSPKPPRFAALSAAPGSLPHFPDLGATYQIQGTHPSPRSTLAVNSAIPGGWIDLTRRGFDWLATAYHFLFDNGSELG
jgi:hypothetical protein